MSGNVETPNVESWSGKSRGDENFPVGSALISARLRPHVHAYYAFARNADDIADSPELAPDDKIRRLDVMEAVLLGHSDAGSPSALGLRASLAACGVTSRHATDLKTRSTTSYRQTPCPRRYRHHRTGERPALTPCWDIQRCGAQHRPRPRAGRCARLVRSFRTVRE